MKYLLLLFICLILCACENTAAETEAVHPTVLTHVYTETPVALPERYMFDAFVAAADGSMVLDLTRNEETDGGSYVLWHSRWQYTDDGQAIEMLWEYPDTAYPVEFLTTAGGEYVLWDLQTDEGSAYRLTFTDESGETVTVENPEAALVTSQSLERTHLTGMHVDGNGTVYLFSGDGVILYDKTLSFRGVLDEWEIDGWTAAGNTVLVWYGERGTKKLAVINGIRGMYEASMPAPAGAKQYFLDGQENLYYHTGEGIFRYSTVETEDGTAAMGEMLLHYGNSNLYEVAAWSVRILDDGRILVAYQEREPGYSTYIPVIMTPVPDVDLSEITVLELVTSDSDAAARLGRAVVRFNKNHPDTRIMWNDYSGYNTADDPSAGEARLALDMSTGLIRPDIYYGAPSRDGFALLLRTENYTDLTPVLEDDPVYNLDNLVGAVKNTYTIDGKLMAMPLYLYAETALTSPAFFSEGDTRTSWTIEEFLTLAKNLPEGVMMRNNLRKDNALQALLGTDWPGLFIDQAAGRCDFNSADFVGLLTLMQQLSQYGSGSREGMEEGENQYIAFQEGRILIAGSSAGSLTGYVKDKRYGEDRLMIGYPTRDGLSGTTLATYAEVFVLTGTCTAPALAWECIREVVADLEVFDFTMPVWKSMLEETVAEAMQPYHFLSYEGSTFRNNMPFELSADGTYRGEPGMTARLTEEDAERYIAWLDTVGRPLNRCVIPAEVWTIVNEEMSRFYEGAADAVGCAGAIQSRVQLWLDENG